MTLKDNVQVNSDNIMVLLPLFKTIRSSSYTFLRKKKMKKNDQELF